MAASQNNEDSDLEIIPNPEPTTNIVDLSTNDETVQSVIVDMNNEQQKRQQFSKKRSIDHVKEETIVNEPPVKRRKLNNQPKQEQKEIVIKQKTASISNKTKRQTVAKSQFDYHTIYPGINYRGKCLNHACIAYNEPVTMKRGFGIFEPSKEFTSCPGCTHAFKLRTIFLYKCVATIESRQLGETNVKRERVSANGHNILIYKYQSKEITRRVKVDPNKNSSNNSNSFRSTTNSQNESENVLKFNVERHGYENNTNEIEIRECAQCENEVAGKVIVSLVGNFYCKSCWDLQ
eukprot:5322_1